MSALLVGDARDFGRYIHRDGRNAVLHAWTECCAGTPDRTG